MKVQGFNSLLNENEYEIINKLKMFRYDDELIVYNAMYEFVI